MINNSLLVTHQNRTVTLFGLGENMSKKKAPAAKILIVRSKLMIYFTRHGKNSPLSAPRDPPKIHKSCFKGSLCLIERRKTSFSAKKNKTE